MASVIRRPMGMSLPVPTVECPLCRNVRETDSMVVFERPVGTTQPGVCCRDCLDLAVTPFDVATFLKGRRDFYGRKR